MSEQVDIAILGGGCAGLSLAARLAAGDLEGRRVVVLEGRHVYERDRTWCGWALEPHPFAACVDVTWSRWKVRHQGSEVLHRSDDHRYEHLRADRFYAEAQSQIARASGVELRLGVQVSSVESGGEVTRIATDAGPIEAAVVVDTRPSGEMAPQGALLQHFLGQEITTTDPVFDPHTATLMDFDVSQEDGIHFVYVLPFTATRALVESTVLSPHPLGRGAYEARIQDYVANRLGTRVESVDYVEQGIIPMHPLVEASTPSRGVIQAGTLGGAVKPSSGYAFHTIQRTTATLAASLLGHGRPQSTRPRSRLDGWLDAIFLSFIRSHPERGPEVFHRLFQSIEPDVLVRFMMERASPADRLRVIGSMPKLPFAREALRVCAL